MSRLRRRLAAVRTGRRRLAAGPAGVIDKRRELFAELRGVLLTQVDLVFRATHTEPDGLFRRPAIKIVF